MNTALTEYNEQGMFVTMVLGMVNIKTGHLDFCNAGHNPPLLNNTFMEMEPNAPIGLWPDLDYVGEEIEDIKGQQLFIYTDGLNEAENPQQEQFGEERIADILKNGHFQSTREVVEHLYSEVERHRNGAEPNDDLTMLCLQIDR